jgi:tetratricopeptide (TPR) repeat protein
LERIGNALVSYSIYLQQMVFPARLAVPYPLPPGGTPFWKAGLALCLLAGATWGVFVCRKKRPYLFVGWLWYVGMLVPVIGLIQISYYAHADRYTYLPGIGMAIAGTWAVADWSAGWKYRRLIVGGLMVTAIATLAVCGHIQTSYWKDNPTLWARALACTSDNAVALNNMGTFLVKHGKLEDAIVDFKKSLQIMPQFADAMNNLGKALALQGADDEAIGFYQKALEIKPDFLNARLNLGNLLLKHGRLDEAAAQFRSALEIQPDAEEAQYNLGKALLLKGDYDGAVACFQKMAPLSPVPLERWQSLAKHFEEEEDWKAVAACYRQAIKINPRSAESWVSLAKAFYRNGDFAAAIDSLQQALDANPDEASIQSNLALLLATAPDPSLRNSKKAVALAARANQLSGGANPLMLHTLAAAYAADGNYRLAADTARHALELAVAQKQDAQAAVLRQELDLYEAGGKP